MPLYVGDYMADTLHLTTEQHGAYLLLLMAYWRNRGPLPASPERLKSVCKLSEDQWQTDMPILQEFFDTVSLPGKWVHKRVDREIEAAIKRKTAAVERGKKGAAARTAKKETDEF